MWLIMFYTVKYLQAVWNEIDEDKSVKDNLRIEEMPYLTIMLVAVFKILVCLIWYRLRARGNRIEYTVELFLLRVLYDIGETIFLVIFAMIG